MVLDFVFDRCANGQQPKCLTITDEFTKEGLAIDVNGRIRSPRVTEVLSRLGQRTRCAGLPAQRQRAGVRIEGAAVLDRRSRHRDRIDRAWQALAEWRHRELQRQIPRRSLSLEWFYSRTEAQIVIESWRRHYNHASQHPSVYMIEEKRLC